jgi:hypothetical protein
MIQGISLIIKIIRDVWNNFKNAPNINQERYDLKGVAEVSSDEVQNKCKRDCACEKKKEYKQLKGRDERKN